MLTPAALAEALLFASGEPLKKKELAALLEISEGELAAVVADLSNSLRDRGLSVIETDTVVELRTTPEASDAVKKLRENELSRDLGTASLETLAIIAYQGGATRSEIDWVRGVNSSASLRTLLLRGLIEGKEDATDKRRTRYALTPDAFAHLGITKASDLPRADELSSAAKAIVEAEQAAVSESSS